MRLPLPGGVQRPAILLLLAILATFVQTAIPTLLTEHNNAGHVISRIMSADEAFRFMITKYFPFVDKFSASMLDARDIITQIYADIDTLVHCNGNSHSVIEACLRGLQAQVIDSLSENKLIEARKALGKALYTVQINAPSQDTTSTPDPALRYLEDIKQKIGKSQFRLLFGVGPTLAVIVDTAGSMTEIMQSVLAMAVPIVMAHLETSYEPSAYLITTFDVAETGPVTATSDFEIFRSALYGLEASGGIDCTRLAMKGLLDAIEILDEGSDLLIFTDAVPEDVGLAKNVVAMALEKHISLQIFRFDSQCDDFVSTENGKSLSKKVYTTVTSATSGRLHSLPRPKAAKTGGIVNSLVAIYDELMLEIVEDLGTSFDSRIFYVPVDSHVTGLVISLTGSDLRMRVSGPTGMVLISSFPGAEHIESSEGELWKINDPSVGSWTIRLSGSGSFSLDVTAVTQLHFSDTKFPAEKVPLGKVEKSPTFEMVRRQPRYGNSTTTDTTISGAGTINSIASATTVSSSSGTETSAKSTTASTSVSISCAETATETSGATFVPTNSANTTNTSTAPSRGATTSVDPDSSTTFLSISLVNSSIPTGTNLLLASLTNPTSLSVIPGNGTSVIPSTTAGNSLANENSIAGATLVSAGSANATTGFTSLATASTTSIGNRSTTATVTPLLTISTNSTSTTVSSTGNTTGLTNNFPSTTSETLLFGNASTTVTVTLSLAASVNSTSATAPSPANSTKFTLATATTASYLNGSTIASRTQSLTLSLASSFNSASVITSLSGNFTDLTGATPSTTSGTLLFGNGTNATNTVPVRTNSINAASKAIPAGNTTSSSSPTASLTGSTASFGNETRTTTSNSNSTTPTTSSSIEGSGASSGTSTANGFSFSTNLTISSTAPQAPFVNGTKGASSSPTGADSMHTMSNVTPYLSLKPSSNITRASVSGGFSLDRISLANSTISHFSALSTSFTRVLIITGSYTTLTNNLSTGGMSVTSGASSSFSSNMQSSVGPPIFGSSVLTETTEHSISDTYALNDSTEHLISSASSIFDPTNRPISTTSTLINNIQTPSLITSYFIPTATGGLLDLTDGPEVTVTEIVYTTTSYCPITVCSSTSSLSSCMVTNSVATITLTSTIVVPCNRCPAPSHLITVPPVALSSDTPYPTPSYNDLTVIEIIYITTSLCPLTITSMVSGSTTEPVTDSTSTLTLTMTSTKPCRVCGPNRATITLSLVPSSPNSGAVYLSSPILTITSIVSVGPPPQPLTLIRPGRSSVYQCEGLGCGPAGNLETSPAGSGCGGSGCESPQSQSSLLEVTLFAPGGGGSTGNPAGLLEVIITTTSSCESTGSINALITPTAVTPIGLGSVGALNSPLATILTLQIGSRSIGTPKGIPTATLMGSGVSRSPEASYGSPTAVTIAIGDNGSAKAPPAAVTITLGENGPAKASHSLPAEVTIALGENGSTRASYGLPAAAVTIALGENGSAGASYRISAATAIATTIIDKSGPPEAPSGPPTAVTITTGESGSPEAPYGPPAVVTTTSGENGPAKASHNSPAAVTTTLDENGSDRSSYGLPAAAAAVATVTLSGGGSLGASYSLHTVVTVILGENGSAKASNILPATAPTITSGTPHGPSASSAVSFSENESARASYVLPTATAVKLGGSESSKSFYGLPAALTITRGENGSPEASYGPPTPATVTLGGKESLEAPSTASTNIALSENGSPEASHSLLAATKITPGGSELAGTPSFASFFTLILPPASASAGISNGPLATLVTPVESGSPKASNTPSTFILTIPGRSGSAGAPSVPSVSMLTLPIGGGSAGGPSSASGLTLIAPVGSETSITPTRTATSTANSTNGYHGPYFTGGTEKTLSFVGQSIGLGLMVIFVAGMVML